MNTSDVTIDRVKNYYGKKLQGNGDLKTSACCSVETMPARHKEIVAGIDDEILDRFYGCGSPIPPALDGRTILDLGCGTGRDVYLAACLAGENGRVIGVDMTDEQLAVARRHVASQMEVFGFKQSNVEFCHGYIEDLATAGIADASVDIVISNCVINLSPDKQRVFSEIFRVLKPGGELYFADVFAGRRVPPHLAADPVLYGECLSGALYIEDFRRMLTILGCPDYRIVSKRLIEISDTNLADRIGPIEFGSITARAFKLDDLEDLCEDYGQIAIYKGTIADMPYSFELDDHHLFETGKAMPVCGNTASMLSRTRFGEHFKIIGNRETHFGPFDCGPSPRADTNDALLNGCC